MYIMYVQIEMEGVLVVVADLHLGDSGSVSLVFLLQTLDSLL